MPAILRVLIPLVAVLLVALGAAAPGWAGNQLFKASWSVKTLGNERTGGTGESSIYSAVVIPGLQCNGFQPRCPFASTPTDGSGNFHPFGFGPFGFYCAPWFDFGGMGTSVRPAKGETQTTGGKMMRPVPPLYRNPAFFTPSGAPNRTACSPASTGFTPGGKGRAQVGDPITGTILAANTASSTNGGLSFAAAPASPFSFFPSGLRVTAHLGERTGYLWYDYTYTYATLRNGAGFFGAGGGPGSFAIQEKLGMATVASIRVQQGAAKFGGTMRMLGALTAKSCRYRNGGCSRGTADWRFEAIGADAMTSAGAVTGPYLATTTAMYFNTGLGQLSTVAIEGLRFPWTTGSVTVTAIDGFHKTVHYARGYDNRGSVQPRYPYEVQAGTLQLVSPVVTRWMQPGLNFHTAGIAILRFVPEPRGWLMLAAGAALLGIGARIRRR